MYQRDPLEHFHVAYGTLDNRGEKIIESNTAYRDEETAFVQWAYVTFGLHKNDPKDQVPGWNDGASIYVRFKDRAFSLVGICHGANCQVIELPGVKPRVWETDIWKPEPQPASPAPSQLIQDLDAGKYDNFDLPYLTEEEEAELDCWLSRFDSRPIF